MPIGEEGGEQDGDDFGAAMHIVLDDLLQADAHMDRRRRGSARANASATSGRAR